ncbi:PRKR-interacting protein 1 [Strongyloides ratti]|uniref:PRKR-interacting protein 1 n=1 Tax=Strongyloides ratti TaxID=34506 RepID=A0A090LIB3_STRRB|nr:PRKR-interacting protein 1 [Strongyloides ratti]CEF67205.1 PRKR-interacting protein 1 [Strongyloides ratti]
MNNRAKRRGPTVEELEKKATDPYDAMRVRLNYLEKNIDKLVEIPAIPEEEKPREAPDFVRNVVGSSAAAGSAEFHIFRNNRRREYERLEFIDKHAKKEELDKEYYLKRKQIEEEEAERTAKKRAKRQKRKEKEKQQKKNKSKSKSKKEEEEKEDSDTEDES